MNGALQRKKSLYISVFGMSRTFFIITKKNAFFYLTKSDAGTKITSPLNLF
jgi:hypothetical protein